MKLLYLFVFQLVLFSLSQPSLCEARNTLSVTASEVSAASRRETSSIVRRNAPSRPPPSESDMDEGFIAVDYTLMTANSPDCESSLVDNFPVRVQYRRASPGQAPSAWMDSPFAPTMTG